MLQEALHHTNIDHPDQLYLQTSADVLWKFLKAKNKSINTCIQLSGVRVVPQPALQPGNSQSSANRNPP